MARKIIDALAEDMILTVLDTTDIGSRKLKEIVSEHKDEITTSLEHIQQEYIYLKLCLSFQTFTILAHEKDLKISKQFFLSIINDLNTKHQNVFNVYTAANREEEYGNAFEKEDIAAIFIREAKLSDTSFEVKEDIKKIVFATDEHLKTQYLWNVCSYASDPTFAPVLSPKGLFSFKGRRNRLAYFLVNFVMLMIFRLCESMFNDPTTPLFATYVALALLFIAIYITLTNTTKRFHDLNHPSWFAAFYLIELLPIIEPAADGFRLLIEIPIGLYLTFWHGTDGDNRYGHDPLKTKPKHPPVAKTK